MYAGAAHADMAEYRSCIQVIVMMMIVMMMMMMVMYPQLWNYALGLKIVKETLVSSDTSFTVRAVIQVEIAKMMMLMIMMMMIMMIPQLYLNILTRDTDQHARDQLTYSDVLTTTK